MNLKEKIIVASQQLGIDKIGFASAESFEHLEYALHEQKERGHTSGFEHTNIAERIHPAMTFEQPKTIISIALAYPPKINTDIPRDTRRGQMARSSWGIDYHTILREKLTQLVDWIKTQANEQELEHWRFKIQVDTGEMIDVAVAQRAGLGFIGRNGLLITEEFGSFVYLGEIITNIELEPDTPVALDCGTCTRCITHCPTQALLGNGQMNAQKCLSYQTQTKNKMPINYRKKMGKVIYGCDICQLVCPYNQGKDIHHHPQMEPKVEEALPQLVPMLQMNNKTFQQQFGHLAGAWRGKKPLQRNALIALANLGAKESLPEIETCLKDVRPVIRGTAAWTIGKLGVQEADKWSNILAKQLEIETEVEVREEMETALQMLAIKQNQTKDKK